MSSIAKRNELNPWTKESLYNFSVPRSRLICSVLSHIISKYIIINRWLIDIFSFSGLHFTRKACKCWKYLIQPYFWLRGVIWLSWSAACFEQLVSNFPFHGLSFKLEHRGRTNFVIFCEDHNQFGHWWCYKIVWFHPFSQWHFPFLSFSLLIFCKGWPLKKGK